MLKKYKLFQHGTSSSDSRGWKIFYWAWNLAWVIMAGVGLAGISLFLAPATDRVAMVLSYLKNPYILTLNVAPVLLLILFLYYVTGRAPVAYWLTALLVEGASVVNQFKLLLRNDPLIFEDVLLWKEATNMAGNYSLYMTQALACGLVAVVIMGIFIHVMVRGRFREQGAYRFLGIGCCIVAFFPLKSQLWDYTNYAVNTKNIELINQWSTTEVYYSKGFVYPFLYSIQSAYVTPPDGYDEAYVEELLAQYPSADIEEDKQVSVISIMLEAYADFSDYGIDGLSEVVYADYHALEEESYSGTLVTNIFAGGTVDSERCFLTGYANLRSFRSNTNSYPWYFQEQGYTVMGAHPCYEWFYNRQNINEYLGFEEYWFVENYYDTYTNGEVGLDNVFFPSLIDMWEDNLATGQPLFAYNLSYQGHGPYSTEQTWWGDDYVVSDQYSQESLNIMNNYFGSIYDTNQYLVEFFDYYRESEEPVIIILFGDHKPWFGDGNSVYTELGMDFDMSTQEGFYEYYSTSYLIWANDAAKETLGNDVVGEGPDISATYLMNLVFQQAGWEGNSYMQFTDTVMEQVPVQNVPTGLYVEDGTLTETLSPEGESLMEDFDMVEYYWQKNFLYGDLVS